MFLGLGVYFDDVVLLLKLNDAAFDLSNGPVIDEVLFLLCWLASCLFRPVHYHVLLAAHFERNAFI